MEARPAAAVPDGADWLRRLVAARYPLLVVAAVVAALPGIHDNSDWGLYFAPAAHALVGQGDVGVLSIFARHPDLQVGPLALLLAVPLELLSPWPAETADVVCSLGWVVLVVLAERAAVEQDPERRDRHALVALLAGSVGLVLWHALAYYRHLDDLVVLVAAGAALLATARRRPWLQGVALGLAAGAKPWGLGLLPLVLALPRRRDRLAAAGTALAVVAVTWAPFVLGDTRTLGALAGFRVPVDRTATLTLLGVATGDPMPGWARPAQLAVALLLGAVAATRSRWALVPLVVVAARLGLDPASWPYYYSGLVAATLLWDLVGSARRVPLWTIAVVAVQYDLRWLLNSGTALATLNLVLLAAVAMLALAPHRVRFPGLASPPALRAASAALGAPGGTSPARSR
jgi:hypothetical protein